jgi:hypothetical protein
MMADEDPRLQANRFGFYCAIFPLTLPSPPGRGRIFLRGSRNSAFLDDPGIVGWSMAGLNVARYSAL